MEQDLRACPSCGAPAPASAPCPYCSWTPEATPQVESEAESERPLAPQSATQDHPQGELAQASEPVAASTPSPSDEPASDQAREAPPANFRQLLDGSGSVDESEEVLEQVPEEMRGLLAARLKAAGEGERDEFREQTEASLRNQGYSVEQDARGARIAGTPGAKAPELSPRDVVKMASELDGGVQPQSKLPICEECQAASPIGSDNCQWCGEPFPQGAQ